jgi:tetratricopeptide (TPR) repeat protein
VRVEDDTHTVCSRVKMWLEDAPHDWLLVVDNMDNINLASKKYLPQRNGSVLFTTRDRRLVGRDLTPTDAGIFVPPMSNSDSSKAFLRLVGSKCSNVDIDDVSDLVQQLDNIPLAVAQAAAYIRETPISMPRYKEILKDCEIERQELLRYHLPGAQDNPELPSRSIMETWEITADHLQRENPYCMKLLQLLSFFDPQKIPMFLFQRKIFYECESEAALLKAIGILVSFSLISEIDDGLKIHSLVSFWTRRRLKQAPSALPRHYKLFRFWTRANPGETVFKTTVEKAVHVISTVFPQGTFENQERCIALLPHAISVSNHASENNCFPVDMIELNRNIADHLRLRGTYGSAMFYAQIARQACTISNSLEICRADVEHTMGKISELQGNYQGAMDRYQSALGIFKQSMESTNPKMLELADDIALVLARQGKYTESEELGRRVLRDREEVLGINDPATLTSLSNLALALFGQGKFKAAEIVNRKARDGRHRVLGEHHFETLISMHNLAVSLTFQGKYREAEEMQKEAVIRSMDALGAEHPSTLDTKGCLAGIYHEQGRYNEAVALEEEVVSRSKRVLGDDNPLTLEAVKRLSSAYQSQGRYDEAAALDEEGVIKSKEVLGENHPSTLSVMGSLAMTYWGQGRYDEAVILEEEVVSKSKKVLGGNHPSTLAAIGCLASTYRTQGRYDETVTLEEEVVNKSKNVLGNNHPSTLNAMGCLASTYRMQGSYDEAATLEEEVVSQSKNVLGDDHPSTLHAMGCLTSTYRVQGKYNEAAVLAEEVASKSKRVLGDNHPSTLRAIKRLALVYQSQGRYDEAVALDEEVESNKVLVNDHPTSRGGV